MRETVIVQQILAVIGARTYLRVWRNNTGSLQDKNGRWVKYGLVGSADIIGVVRMELTICEEVKPEIDGIVHSTSTRIVGRFFALEVKRPGERQSEEQKTFERMVKSMGGFYRVVHSVEEAEVALVACIHGED